MWKEISKKSTDNSQIFLYTYKAQNKRFPTDPPVLKSEGAVWRNIINKNKQKSAKNSVAGVTCPFENISQRTVLRTGERALRNICNSNKLRIPPHNIVSPPPFCYKAQEGKGIHKRKISTGLYTQGMVKSAIPFPSYSDGQNNGIKNKIFYGNVAPTWRYIMRTSTQGSECETHCIHAMYTIKADSPLFGIHENSMGSDSECADLAQVARKKDGYIPREIPNKIPIFWYPLIELTLPYQRISITLQNISPTEHNIRGRNKEKNSTPCAPCAGDFFGSSAKAKAAWVTKEKEGMMPSLHPYEPRVGGILPPMKRKKYRRQMRRN